VWIRRACDLAWAFLHALPLDIQLPVLSFRPVMQVLRNLYQTSLSVFTSESVSQQGQKGTITDPWAMIHWVVSWYALFPRILLPLEEPSSPATSTRHML
jgi:hypothetical protein